jgi:hypothetical protein
MKTFFFMGRNPKTKGGVSWKIWKIERKGRRVTTWWGPATLRRRKVVPVGKLQSSTQRTPPFRSVARAVAYQQARITRKLTKGYQRNVRQSS